MKGEGERRVLNEERHGPTDKKGTDRGTGEKNEVQCPTVNSKHSHACRVKLTWLCNVCAVGLLQWENGVCGCCVL